MYAEMSQTKVLMLCDKGNRLVDTAVEYFRCMLGEDLTVYRGRPGNNLPEDIGWQECDYLISFFSPWIIPAFLIKKASRGAIGFHPGPPEYTGVGCLNFALYENASTYGVTCHFLNNTTYGSIISVKRFKVHSKDTVATLLERTSTYMLSLFYDIAELILTQKELPLADKEQWTGKSTTRKDFDNLCELSLNMNKEEVERRIRATFSTGVSNPKIYLHGYPFDFVAH